jgi:hypothetical protein
MDEAEWLACEVVYQALIHVRGYASLRKLRLVAAAYARWLQSLPSYEHARPCADIIEEVADEPKGWGELELRLYSLPGSDWRLSHTLIRDDQVGQGLSKMVWMTEDEFRRRSESPHAVHLTMIRLLHEAFGNPFRPVAPGPWVTPAAVTSAQDMYDLRDFSTLPVLADLLEEAGCPEQSVLDHCRTPGDHVRGCWVVDLVLGKV